MAYAHYRYLLATLVALTISTAIIFNMNAFGTYIMNKHEEYRIPLPLRISSVRNLYSEHLSNATLSGARVTSSPEHLSNATLPVAHVTTSHGLSSNATTRVSRVYMYSIGGFGNHFFNLACTYGLARTNGRKLVITTKFMNKIKTVLKVTHLSEFEIADDTKSAPGYGFRYAVYEPEKEQLPKKDLLLAVYLQAYRYFSAYEKEVRKLFTINDSLVAHAQTFMHGLNVTAARSTFVSIHVRRGDMDDPKIGRLVPGPEYLRHAMTYFLRKYPNVQFIVCTNDQHHCKTKETYLQPGKLSHIADYGLHYSTFRSAEQDFGLMVQCNHTIMTVGTFGWWGAWLAGGEVIYFNHPLREGSGLIKDFKNEDFYWPTWIGIGDRDNSSVPERPHNSTLIPH